MTTTTKASLTALAGLLVLVASTACSEPREVGGANKSSTVAASTGARTPLAGVECTSKYSFGSAEDQDWAKTALTGFDLAGLSAGSVSRATDVTALAAACVDSSEAARQVLPCPSMNGWPDGWGREESGKVLAGWQVKEVKTSRILITPEGGEQREVTQVHLARAGDAAGQRGIAEWLTRCGAVESADGAPKARLIYAQPGADTVYYVFSSQNWDVESQMSAVRRATARSAAA